MGSLLTHSVGFAGQMHASPSQCISPEKTLISVLPQRILAFTTFFLGLATDSAPILT